ncbi:MAG TPA: hypothetical protein VG387_17380 [Rhizomicrobium sp.]|nr:hypothetical protein [Rhizomicrobium sp.]
MAGATKLERKTAAGDPGTALLPWQPPSFRVLGFVDSGHGAAFVADDTVHS